MFGLKIIFMHLDKLNKLPIITLGKMLYCMKLHVVSN